MSLSRAHVEQNVQTLVHIEQGSLSLERMLVREVLISLAQVQ